MKFCAAVMFSGCLLMTRIVNSNPLTEEIPCLNSTDFVKCVLEEPSGRIGHINEALGFYTDILDANNSVGYMSQHINYKKWPRNSVTGTYDIPFRFDGSYTAHEMTFFNRVFGNFHRGSNIRFVRYTNQDSHLRITDKAGGGCAAFIGYKGQGSADGHVTVSIARPDPKTKNPGCITTSIITHELLHALGFGHEHQRSDAKKWVHMEPNSPPQAQIRVSKDIQISTAYDLASIMHYDTYISPNNAAYLRIVKSRIPTLTSCDWAALNKAYPGKKKAPKCVPHQLPDVCEPAKSCPYKAWQCAEVCLYSCGNDNYGMGRYCQFKGGHQFPRDAMDSQDDVFVYGVQYNVLEALAA